MAAVFKNRTEAGEMLVDRLAHFKDANPLILAMPRGGVPVAYQVAEALDAPLDTIVVRKIGLPSNREFGVGAIAPGNVLVLDHDVLDALGVGMRDLEHVIVEEGAEMRRRLNEYKSGEYAADTPKETIIIVDDGLATGVSARAAIQSVAASYQPQTIIIAAPVCSADTAQTIEEITGNIVCVRETDHLMAIGYWYEDFSEVPDDDVIRYLERAYARRTVSA